MESLTNDTEFTKCLHSTGDPLPSNREWWLDGGSGGGGKICEKDGSGGKDGKSGKGERGESGGKGGSDEGGGRGGSSA